MWIPGITCIPPPIDGFDYPNPKRASKFKKSKLVFSHPDVLSLWKKLGEVVEERDQLREQCRTLTDIRASLVILHDKLTQMENTISSIDRVFEQLFIIMTTLCNDILDGSASEGSVKKTISNLEQLLVSEDIEVYYFERGAVYSAVDDSSKTQLQVEQTEKQDLDSTVYRCNCIGYNIKKLEIRRPAKVVLYKFNDLNNMRLCE